MHGQKKNIQIVLKAVNIPILNVLKNITDINDNRIVMNRSLTQTFRDPLKTRTVRPKCRNCYDPLPLIPGSQRATKKLPHRKAI
jgi:hypothetical protein